jgi:hypothetical protein
MSMTAKQFIFENQNIIEGDNLPAIFGALADTPNFTNSFEKDLAAFVIFYTLAPDSFDILDGSPYPVVVSDPTCSGDREGYSFYNWHCPREKLSNLVSYRVKDSFDDKLREVLIRVGTQLFCSRGGRITADMIKRVILGSRII